MSHLILSRKAGERVLVGDEIVVQVVDVRGDNVRLSFEAPPNVIIHREEVHEAIEGAA